MRTHLEKSIFGNIFLMANRLQKLIDRDFKEYNITAKQWFLLASIGEFNGQAPSIKQVADLMGSSHQNIKQLALKLESNGYINMIRDPRDKRVLRLSLTQKNSEFWKDREKEDMLFFNKLFGDFSDDEVEKLEALIQAMNNNISDD